MKSESSVKYLKEIDCFDFKIKIKLKSIDDSITKEFCLDYKETKELKDALTRALKEREE